MKIEMDKDWLPVNLLLVHLNISMASLYRYIAKGFPVGKRLSDVDTRKFWHKSSVEA